MKIFHEFPISHLKRGREFTDGEYCLPHLLDKYTSYLEYFTESKAQGRYIIMDNSLHELGEPYTEERLLYWLHHFKPNEFIVPDFWEDKTKTLVSAKKWIQIIYPEGVMPVAVVQGKSLDEALECYYILKQQGYQKIAFSYGADWYEEEGLKYTTLPQNKFVTKAHGRYHTIKTLYDKDIIQKGDRIHLLGCNIPQEFSWYKDLNIESIDTSNPVIHGFLGIKYNDWGLEEKQPNKVDTFEGVEENWDIVEYNLNKFKEFVL